MATKQVQISPIAARLAGCTATCESYATGVTTGLAWGGVKTWTNYQCVATPAGAWFFDHWEVKTKTRDYEGDETTDGNTTRVNPYPRSQDHSYERQPSEATIAYSQTPDPDAAVEYTIAEIVAVFDRNARVPTHLPVDSSNLAAPVQIVHDGTSNLPVADF